MHTRWGVAGYILQTYANCGWPVRLFVLIRYLVCPWRKLLDYISPLIGDGELLDIGCGHGLLLHLLQIRKRQPCVGIDHDRTKITIAKKSIPIGAPITVVDTSQQHQLSAKKFHCITLVDVFYAVAPCDWPHIWDQIHRQLDPDGVLVIKETINHPKWKYWICLLQEILATKILKYTKGQFPFLPSCDYYLKELAQNGFEVVEHLRVDQGYLWPHYLFIATPLPEKSFPNIKE
jgi:2-polyprenyl-3-methyl-5-hydroxy-6-metoxy-1,4-benzoquinol methylase